MCFIKRYRLSHISDRQQIFPILHHHGSNSRFKKYWVKPDGTGPQRQLRFQIHHHYTQGPISITSLHLQLWSPQVSDAAGTLLCRITAPRASAATPVLIYAIRPTLVDECIFVIDVVVLRAPPALLFATKSTDICTSYSCLDAPGELQGSPTGS